MLTVKQFAEKVGVDKTAVIKWIHKGQIPGVVKVKPEKGKSAWKIPENAMRPENRFYHDGIAIDRTCQRFSPQTESVVDPEHKRQLDFVATHLTWSVKSIAHSLGVSTARVRELFDELLEMEVDEFGCEEDFQRVSMQ